MSEQASLQSDHYSPVNWHSLLIWWQTRWLHSHTASRSFRITVTSQFEQMKHPSEAAPFRNQMAGNPVQMSWRNNQFGLKIRPSPCSTQKNKVLQMPHQLHIYSCSYPLVLHLFGKARKQKVKEYNYYTLFVHWTPVQETVIANSQKKFGDIL